MKKLGMLVIGLLVGAVGASALAQDDGSRAAEILGIFYSHESQEDFEMSIGMTRGERPRPERRLVTHRFHVNVPSHYGPIIAITGDAARAVIWYRDDRDVVRNAVLEGPAENLYTLTPTETKDLETTQRR
jgi:hypothetical protein